MVGDTDVLDTKRNSPVYLIFGRRFAVPRKGRMQMLVGIIFKHFYRSFMYNISILYSCYAVMSITQQSPHRNTTQASEILL